MLLQRKKSRINLLIIAVITCVLYLLFARPSWPTDSKRVSFIESKPVHPPPHRQWRSFPERYPVDTLRQLPTGTAPKIPKVQVPQPQQAAAVLRERLARKDAVKGVFIHCWAGYKSHAWLRDEVKPVSGSWGDPFGGWAATLVDGLDSLWILGLKDEFAEAVEALDMIDFYNTRNGISVFETVIRYMGGLLGAYEISGQQFPKLLQKATELGDMIMGAFDTPTRWPINFWSIEAYLQGIAQEVPMSANMADSCSLSMELTRLTQETGDLKYYDAAQRIMDIEYEAQNDTQLPGMWPMAINPNSLDFSSGNSFTLGAMADSAFEYLPKLYLTLDGTSDQPRIMYEQFIEVAKKHIFLRALNSDNLRIRISADAVVTGTTSTGGSNLQNRGIFQHLGCFTGGMVALGAQIFERPQDMPFAEELTQGCIWAYNQSANGIAPEIFHFVPCYDDDDCLWSDDKWHTAIASRFGVPSNASDYTEQIAGLIHERRLPRGFVDIPDRRYILRPEAIESVFILHRITGKQEYADAAWQMFEAIDFATRSRFGASAIEDVTVSEAELRQADSMESFWLAETLKYFYLVFENFDVVSLDEWVLNTEAHPLKRGIKPKKAAVKHD